MIVLVSNYCILSQFLRSVMEEIDNKLRLRIDILISVLLVIVCFIRIECFFYQNVSLR